MYRLNVVVADNGCSLPKHDTVQVAFTAVAAPNTAPVLTSTLPPAPVPETAPAVVRVAVGAPYTATLLGTDADANPLTLSATGEGFDLAAVGMVFGTQNGAGRATGTFAWAPTCATASAAAVPGGLVVHFLLTESGACAPVPRTRTVRFELVRPADSVAFRPPNVITPNGDGLNDFFVLDQALPSDFCGSEFAGIRIFSLWGQQVYASPARTFRWGGAGAGGTYYYLVTFTDGRRFKGWLEVLP